MYNVLSKNIQFICTCTSFRNVEKSKSNVNLKFFFIPPANKVWGVYRNHPVRPSMYLVSATPPKPLIGFL